MINDEKKSVSLPDFSPSDMPPQKLVERNRHQSMI